MSAIQADVNNRLPLRALCRVLSVSHTGYYDWRERAPSQRETTNAVLTESIRQVHEASDCTYGMPRVRPCLLYTSPSPRD